MLTPPPGEDTRLAHLYHLHHSQQGEDQAFWLHLAQTIGEPILELGCGTGRILVPVAQAGYQIFGIDNDPSMLAFLGERITSIRLQPQVRLMDVLEMQLEQAFQLIIMPCNTYSTFDLMERRTLLEKIVKHLKPDGCFAAALPNPITLAGLPAYSEPEVEDELIHPTSGYPVEISSSWERRGTKLLFSWHYNHLFPDGRAERYVLTTAHFVTTLQQYLDELQSAGLWPESLYGDFDQSPFSPDSPALIWVARL